MNKIQMKYLKINEDDIIQILIKISCDWKGIDVISPSNIASILKTSRYQVNKNIKLLKNKKLVTYKSLLIGNDYYDYCPPYNGYCLSELGKEKYKKEIKKIEEEELKLIKECFNDSLKQ